jgi:hypothetical protein
MRYLLVVVISYVKGFIHLSVGGVPHECCVCVRRRTCEFINHNLGHLSSVVTYASIFNPSFSPSYCRNVCKDTLVVGV